MIVRKTSAVVSSGCINADLVADGVGSIRALINVFTVRVISNTAETRATARISAIEVRTIRDSWTSRVRKAFVYIYAVSGAICESTCWANALKTTKGIGTCPVQDCAIIEALGTLIDITTVISEAAKLIARIAVAFITTDGVVATAFGGNGLAARNALAFINVGADSPVSSESTWTRAREAGNGVLFVKIELLLYSRWDSQSSRPRCSGTH